MQQRSDFKEKRVHKDAGMEFTIIMCSLPVHDVRGEGDGSGLVRFTAYPGRREPRGELTSGVRFALRAPSSVTADSSTLSTSSGRPKRPTFRPAPFVVYSSSPIDNLRSLVADSLTR
jgi:hypothetical protein